jgi:Asp-tRNA(Asn)/Glu-tRNA(Gln) amidotransferase A subunit family amidase
MPAHEQLGLFRAKQLSPVEILRAQIRQIEAIGTSINAVTYSHSGQESEARYHRGNPRPLDGITVAVKDEYDKGGWIVTAGSVLLRDSVKHENHSSTSCLRPAPFFICKRPRPNSILLR